MLNATCLTHNVNNWELKGQKMKHRMKQRRERSSKGTSREFLLGLHWRADAVWQVTPLSKLISTRQNKPDFWHWGGGQLRGYFLHGRSTVSRHLRAFGSPGLCELSSSQSLTFEAVFTLQHLPSRSSPLCVGCFVFYFFWTWKFYSVCLPVFCFLLTDVWTALRCYISAEKLQREGVMSAYLKITNMPLSIFCHTCDTWFKYDGRVSHDRMIYTKHSIYWK